MDSQPALVTTDPEMCGGRTCFAGHRVPVKMVLRRLDAGERLADMQGDFPWLTAAFIAAARAYVASEPAKPEIRFGLLKGEVTLAPDFDSPLPDSVLAGFQGEAALDGVDRVAAGPVLDEAALDDVLTPAAKLPPGG